MSFWKRSSALLFNKSSGLGGPGSLKAVTENGQEYNIGLNDCTQANEIEIIDRFLGERPVTSSEELERTHEIGKWRWIDFLYTKYFVRKDYADKIISEWKKTLDEKQLCTVIDVARELLDPQKELPRMVYSKTQAICEEEEIERCEREEWRAKNRLVEGEDYEWKEFKGVGLERGYYLLLFKENEDGSISGTRWTIIYQLEQYEEGGFRDNPPIEAYNLYYKSYKNMGGILKYPKEGEDKEIYKYSTLSDGIHSYGNFWRTYFTLEQAKAAALKRNEFFGWGNYYKDNLLRRNWADMTVEETKKDYFRAVKRQKEMQLLFPEICGEVFQILRKQIFPCDAIHEISGRFGLSKNDVRLILHFFSDAGLFC